MTPRLRFPEFTDKWKIEKLGDLVSIFDGTHQTPTYVSNGVPFYSVEQVTANNFEDTKYIAESVFQKEKRRPQKGDILMTRIGDIGTVRYLDWNVRASFYVSLALIKQSELVSNRFLCHLIRTSSFQSELWSRTIHVAFPKKINLGEISNCLLKIPSQPEQGKIADFLTYVDDRITASERKLALFQKYKKGVMQKLLTQQIRFAGFTQKWQQKTLADIAYSETSPLSANQIEGQTGEYKVYGASGILQTLDKYHYEQEYIAIVKDGAGAGRISFCEPKSSVLGTMVVIQPKENIDRRFLYYLLHLIDFKKYTIGSTIPHVYFKQYSKEGFELPIIHEQEKIAEFLASVDDRIKLEEAKLEEAKLFKKSLLQRMFV